MRALPGDVLCHRFGYSFGTTGAFQRPAGWDATVKVPRGSVMLVVGVRTIDDDDVFEAGKLWYAVLIGSRIAWLTEVQLDTLYERVNTDRRGA